METFLGKIVTIVETTSLISGVVSQRYNVIVLMSMRFCLRQMRVVATVLILRVVIVTVKITLKKLRSVCMKYLRILY